MHLLAFCQAFNKQLIFRVPLKNNLANNMHSEKFALPSAKKIHSAKSPFNTRQRKTFVCSLSVSLSALGKLTYLPNVYFFSTQQTKSLPSAKEKHWRNKNSNHILKL
jgi:hypothetical protein